MFNRENWVGVVLLGLCAFVAGALLLEIFTNVSFQYTGSQMSARLIAIGLGIAISVMSARAWGGRFRRWRGGSSGPVGWPHNDVPHSWPRRLQSDVKNDPPDQPPS